MAEFDPENLAQKICELCYENSGKYCCPRCSILFCSLDCYRLEKHSECSESFYRDSVHRDLLYYKADEDGSMQKMVDILTKLHKAEAAGGYTGGLHDGTEAAYDDSDEEEVIALHDRIKGLSLDNADDLWDSLTVDERNEFASMISHGEIGHLMPDWEPWWMFKMEKRSKKNIKKHMEDTKHLIRCPAHKMVPDMTALTTVEPSKAIKYNITNILASYAFTLRYFHGEVDPVEFAIYFLSICDNLDKNTNFDEPALAMESVVQNCLQSELIHTDQKSLDVLRYDTFMILQGPCEDNPKHFLKSALSHLHRILSRARVTSIKQPNVKPKRVKDKKFSKMFPEHEVKNMVKLDPEKLKKCLKKLKYYLSYVESYSMEYELEEE